MSVIELFLLSLYFLILFILSVYGLHRLKLTYLYYKYPHAYVPKSMFGEESLPLVTVQLPVYNEQYVLPRLVEAVSKIKYPLDKLEIQILDDSTDETVQIGKELETKYRALGFDIHHIHRVDRTGFKAGALEEGMKVAKGQFIAVFDADFIPPAHFLEKTIHPFTDEKVGMVQVRWEHINRSFSWLTKAQGILLDGHFVMEHTARARSGRFFNFNGTAGIWRKTCIQDAGGWQHDTITEDLDLSYRAQLKGWDFVYMPDVVSPAELPIEMNAFRTQQHRWTKGSMETAKKLLGQVLKSGLSRKIKSEAFFHLTGNIAYILIVLLSLLMPLSIYIRIQNNFHYALLADLPFLLTGTLSLVVYYACSQKETQSSWLKRCLVIPFALTVGVGISINNCKAVLEALIGYKTGFTRTPKYNVTDENPEKEGSWKKKLYKGDRTILPYLEMFFALYFTVAVLWFIQHGVFWSLPFLVMFQIGFVYVSLSSLFQRSI